MYSSITEKKKDKVHIETSVLLLILTILFQSCFTGVEGTKKITLSKKDLSTVAPTEEELFLSDIDPGSIETIEGGTKFIVNDKRLNIIIETEKDISLQEGDTVIFSHIEQRMAPDGETKGVMVFKKGETLIRLPLDRQISELKNVSPLTDLPMLTDLSLVEKVKEKLLGKTFWTKTTLWYDIDLNYKTGRKYIPVTITSIEAGNAFFPVRISFSDENSEQGCFLMNIGSSTGESRGFAKLFSLRDPRKDYKNISDENWKAIQEGKVKLGMTKEECRLSLGNPSDVAIGHDYSRALERWQYPDGTYLNFSDDILVNYR